MPSLRARLFNRYLRMTFRQLPLPDMEPARLRRTVEHQSLPFLPRGIERRVIETPVRGEWQTPAQSSPGKIILYFHGGGYLFGSPATHRSLTYALALATAAPVFSLDYRLAPEDRCPAAIEDALAAYKMLRDEGWKPNEIFFGGDSAGGGLALATMQALAQKGEPRPAGAFLYSPWADLSFSGASARENEHSDAMFKADSIRRGAAFYLGGLDPRDPRASPLFGRFDGMPPLLIFASDSELLRDDATRVVEKACAAGVDVDFSLEGGLAHVWPVFNPLMPESKAAIEKTASFIKSKGTRP